MRITIKRKTYIKKLYKELAIETVGKTNLKYIKLIILGRYGRGTSYCKSWIASDTQLPHIVIGLNLYALENRIIEGYNDGYYPSRIERLNKHILHNRHNALRFMLYHELRHAWQRLNNRHRDNLTIKEFDADGWALAHLNIKKLAQVKPDKKVSEYTRLYKTGISTSKIAELYKIKDPRSIRYHLTKSGISLRRKYNA